MAVDPEHPDDLRQARRFRYPGDVHLKDRPGETLQAVDLSVGGVGLHCGGPLGVGRTVEVVLLDGSVRIKGVVRHEAQTQGQAWRIGIQFLQPQPELLTVALSLRSDP